MIKLTKINGEEFLLNSAQIQIIEAIPESKVLLVNREYYIVTETFDQIIEKIADFNARIADKESYLKAMRRTAEMTEECDNR